MCHLILNFLNDTSTLHWTYQSVLNSDLSILTIGDEVLLETVRTNILTIRFQRIKYFVDHFLTDFAFLHGCLFGERLIA